MQYQLFTHNEIEKNENKLKKLFTFNIEASKCTNIFELMKFCEENSFCFPAVYSFYDNFDNLLYIGKTNNLSNRMQQHFKEGHLKREDLYKVKKIMYIKCNSDTDALILETILINYHNPPFNISHTKGECSLFDAKKVISDLKWNIYNDITEYNQEQINKLNQSIDSFWNESYNNEYRCSLLESWYYEHVVEKDLPETYEYILRKINNCYGRNCHNAFPEDKFCELLKNINIPDFEYRWIQLTRDMYHRNRKCSCFDKAILQNKHMPLNILKQYQGDRYAEFLEEYDFGKCPFNF